MVLMCLGVTGILFFVSRGDCTLQSMVGHGDTSNGTMATEVKHWMESGACKLTEGASWTPYFSSNRAMWLYTVNMSIFMSLSYMVFPGISALKTNNVGADEQGGTLGALWSTKAMSSVISPSVFGALWRVYSSEAPWVVYALASGVTILGFVISLCVPEPLKSTAPLEASTDLAPLEDGYRSQRTAGPRE